MHDKIMILDSTRVITGSWNYSVNDTYRNNNNALVITSQNGGAGLSGRVQRNVRRSQVRPLVACQHAAPEFTQDGTEIGIYFSPEDDVLTKINATLQGAQAPDFAS